MLLLACILNRDVVSITESQLLAENNILKVNLENIKRSEFVTACNQLKDSDNNRLSSTTAFYALQPKRTSYHNPDLARKLEESTEIPEIEEEESKGGGMSLYNIIIIILIIVLLFSLMSKE